MKIPDMQKLQKEITRLQKALTPLYEKLGIVTNKKDMLLEYDEKHKCPFCHQTISAEIITYNLKEID